MHIPNLLFPSQLLSIFLLLLAIPHTHASPCGTDFTYPDNGCNPQCNHPLIASTVTGINYCDSPCGLSGYIYPNSSCYNECPVPLVSTTYLAINWCSSPCGYREYYYPNNDTCKSFCQYTIENHDLVNVCIVPPTPSIPPAPSGSSGLTSQQKNEVDQANSVKSGAGKAASVGIAASSIISSQSSGAVTLISLIKMLEYIRYMKINYPPKLEYMMDSQTQDPISLNFDVSLPESIEKKFPNYPLPGKFGKYGLVSNFVVNYWEALFTLGVVLLVLAVAVLLASKAKDVKYIGRYSIKIRDILKWNFFLIVLCGNIDSVGVFSSLELRTTHFNSFVSVLGTLFCIFINLFVLYLMFMIPYIIYSLRRSRRKVFPQGKILQHGEYNLKTDSQRFAFCGVLFMSFKEQSPLQHSCMFFILFRVYLFNMIIGYLFEYPLAQAILITIMSFLMLGYFSIARPFKNSLELIQTLTYETIIAIVNICVLILAIMDYKNIENLESRARFGDTIIISNIIFNLMAVFFMVVEFVIKAIKVYKLRKTITKTGWRYWLTIITFLLQPEELEMEEDEPHGKEEPSIGIQIQHPSKLLPTPLDDQAGHSPDQIFSILKKISSPISRLSLLKGRISTANSIISVDAFSDVGSKNLLTPSNVNLLQNLSRHSNPSSPRIQPPISSQFNFQDLEQNKFVNESLPVKLKEEKRILFKRNQSPPEAIFSQSQERRRKRNMRISSPPSIVILDNNESMSELSIEAGTGTKIKVNTPHNQSRFSKCLPEKSDA